MWQLLQHFYEQLFDLFRTYSGIKDLKSVKCNLQTAIFTCKILKWHCLYSKLMALFSIRCVWIYCVVNTRGEWLDNSSHWKFGHTYEHVFTTFFHTYPQLEMDFPSGWLIGSELFLTRMRGRRAVWHWISGKSEQLQINSTSLLFVISKETAELNVN